jgi:dynein heavy chain
MPHTQVKALDEQLKTADKEAGLYNSREALLGMPLTDYTAVKKLIEQVGSFVGIYASRLVDQGVGLFMSAEE